MALTERSRSALYLGLSNIVDEEAVQEMMSFFPARDVEEPVTKEFFRAEMSDLRAELNGDMSSLRGELNGDMSSLRAELKGEMAGLRTELKGEMAGLRTEMSAMESRIIRWNLATMFVFAGSIVALVRL